MNNASVTISGAAVKSYPPRVTPDYRAIISPEWAVKMARLALELQAAGLMPVGARKIVAACYGTEPEQVLQALADTRQRYSLPYTVRRLYHGILDPDIRWTPTPEM